MHVAPDRELQVAAHDAAVLVRDDGIAALQNLARVEMLEMGFEPLQGRLPPLQSVLRAPQQTLAQAYLLLQPGVRLGARCGQALSQPRKRRLRPLLRTHARRR